MAGGRGTLGGQEQSIRTLAGARSTETLAATSLVLAGGRHVRLGDVARIVDTAAEQRTFARLDGKPVVGLAITRGKGASDASAAEAVAQKIEALGRAHPDVRFCLIDTSVRNTVGNYESAMHGTARRRRAGRFRRLPVPAGLARHADRGDRPASVGAATFWR